jgi:hypothetical protein
MSYVAASPITLMQLWRLHRDECRGIGSIISDARSGKLPGVTPVGFGFEVNDRQVALSAMLRSEPSLAGAVS